MQIFGITYRKMECSDSQKYPRYIIYIIHDISGQFIFGTIVEFFNVRVYVPGHMSSVHINIE